MCFVQALTVKRPFSFSPDVDPLGVFSGAWLPSARTTYCGPESTSCRRTSVTVPAGRVTSPSFMVTSWRVRRSTVIGPWATVTQPASSEWAVTVSMVTTMPLTSGDGASTSWMAKVPVPPPDVPEPQPAAARRAAASIERRTREDI